MSNEYVTQQKKLKYEANLNPRAAYCVGSIKSILSVMRSPRHTQTGIWNTVLNVCGISASYDVPTY